MGAAFANPYVLPALISGGSGLIGGMMGGNSGQQRQSFEHTTIDPTTYGTDAKASISNALQAAVAHANEPIDLSGATPMAPGMFKASYPPRAVGGFATPGATPGGTPQRVQFSGFDMGPVGTGAGSADSSHAVRRNPQTAFGGQPFSTRPLPMNRTGVNLKPLSPDASMSAGADTTGSTGLDPTAEGSAKLLLHALYSQPNKAAVGV